MARSLSAVLPTITAPASSKASYTGELAGETRSR